MSGASAADRESWPLSLELRVEAVCRAFEAAWQAAGDGGHPPRIEDYLAAAGAADRWPLLQELLRLELYYRRDEPPSPDEYRRRFPDDAERIIPLLGGLTRPVPQPAQDGRGRGAALPSIAGYEVLAEVGRGGMGVVYQARHLTLNRVVALKMIREGANAGAQELARFRAEAEAVARLQHPNIVQIYEVGEHGGVPYFALEFCAGGSLASRLNGTPLPPGEAAGLVETLARAVHVAHQAKIVHRDLKPGNVLLAAGGVAADAKPQAAIIPKITDFGLAKRLEEVGQTWSGAVLGTASYMAPEQAAGRSKEIGPAADVYALGAILYELLSGRPPFRAATDLDTILQVINAEPVPPRRLHAKVPRDLETITLKCLEKDPRRRYATAADLADDLHRFLLGEPIRARPPGLLGRVGRWARSRPALAATWVALALMYLYHLALLGLGDLGERGAYHWFLTELLASWALGAAWFQRLAARPRWGTAVTFGWSAFDVFMLTLLLFRGNGPRSVLLPGYLLLTAATALRFRVGLVWFVTGLCVLSFAGLQAEAAWLRPHLALDWSAWNTFALTLCLLGLIQHLLLRRPPSGAAGDRPGPWPPP
jgi:serine/threonine protein kinase